MKKKIEDMTIKEIMDFCHKQKGCSKCPLTAEGICIDEVFCPAAWHHLKEEFETTELDVKNPKILKPLTESRLKELIAEAQTEIAKARRDGDDVNLMWYKGAETTLMNLYAELHEEEEALEKNEALCH